MTDIIKIGLALILAGFALVIGLLLMLTYFMLGRRNA